MAESARTPCDALHTQRVVRDTAIGDGVSYHGPSRGGATPDRGPPNDEESTMTSQMLSTQPELDGMPQQQEDGLVVIAIIGVLIALLLPAVQASY